MKAIPCPVYSAQEARQTGSAQHARPCGMRLLAEARTWELDSGTALGGPMGLSLLLFLYVWYLLVVNNTLPQCSDGVRGIRLHAEQERMHVVCSPISVES